MLPPHIQARNEISARNIHDLLQKAATVNIQVVRQKRNKKQRQRKQFSQLVRHQTRRTPAQKEERCNTNNTFRKKYLLAILLL